MALYINAVCKFEPFFAEKITFSKKLHANNREQDLFS